MIAEWITCLDKRTFERTGEDLDIIYSRLKSVKAFEKVHPALLQQICLNGYYEELDEGVTLYCQGDFGTNWYAVLSGSLDVNVSSTGDPKDEATICTLGTGTVFGDSVLTNSPRRATVVTSEYCELLRIEAKEFREMWEKHRQYMGTLITNSDYAGQMGAGSSAAGHSSLVPSGLGYGGTSPSMGNPGDVHGNLSGGSNPYQSAPSINSAYPGVSSLQHQQQLSGFTTGVRSTLPRVAGFAPNDNIPQMSVRQGAQPYEPWTNRPCEKIAQAGRVLRILMLSCGVSPGQPSLIRDRKHGSNTYRRCAIGSEMVDWLIAQNNHVVHSRHQAVGMWQALLEEGIILHVSREYEFKDDPALFYRFIEDEMGFSGAAGTQPTAQDKKDAEEYLPEILVYLGQTGPDAIFRIILRRPGMSRTAEEVELIYDELLHIKALSHLSTMVKRELAGVIMFEAHPHAGATLFRQGDEGRSWYIILRGSVNVVIAGKGVVCTLHEGDDFGKLALVNQAPRAASILLREDNCHFLRVDKEDFARILQDVEANTVRLKDNAGQDVLVLEKIAVKPHLTGGQSGSSQPGPSSGGLHGIQYRYSIMAGTSDKMLDYLLETRLDSNADLVGDLQDTFLEDFLLTYPVFLSNQRLCSMLTRHYTSVPTPSNTAAGNGAAVVDPVSSAGAGEALFHKKRKVIHFVLRWCVMALHEFREDPTLLAFINELYNSCTNDVKTYPQLKGELHALEQARAGKITYISEFRKQTRQYVSQTRRSEEHHPEKRKSIRGTDENIFKVYCFDHTYTTLRLPMDTKAEVIATQAASKLCLEDDMHLIEVKSTGERVVFKANDVSVTSALSINGRLFVASRDHMDKLHPLPDQEGPQMGTSQQLELMSSKEVAYQLTILEYELFSCIHEYEFIYHTFGRYNFGKITANLDIFLRRFNEVQYWVVTEMVLCQNLTKRIAILRKFIKIAQYCKEYQNMDTFYAVIMGLSNIAVSRLRETWEKLPMKLRKMNSEFENMLDPTRNHRLYRLAIGKLNPPIIPFLPLLIKDMNFTHEGNRTYFDGLVNFEKMHMIASTIRHIQHCRSEAFNFEPPMTSRNAQEIRTYVRNLKVIDNQRLLTQLSHRLEPKH